MPSADLELCYMSAVKQLDGFRKGELSPVEVLQAQIARAEGVEPSINAFTDTFFESALEAARHAEEIYAKRPDEARPLEGPDDRRQG